MRIYDEAFPSKTYAINDEHEMAYFVLSKSARPGSNALYLAPTATEAKRQFDALAEIASGEDVRINRANGLWSIAYPSGGRIDFRFDGAGVRRGDYTVVLETPHDDSDAARDADDIQQLIETRNRLVNGGFIAGAVDTALLSAARDAGTI